MNNGKALLRSKLLVQLAFGLAFAASAQIGMGQGPPQGSRDVPDAMILVEPVGEQATIAVIYSKPVAHPQARNALSRLAKLAGWKLGQLKMKDQELFDRSAEGERRSLGRQTGIQAEASGVSLLNGAAFRLQPFVEAYRDLKSIDLMFLTGGLADFSGLRFFDDPALRVTLIREGGPYRYSFEIRDSSKSLPKLPLNQPTVPSQPAPLVQGSKESRSMEFGPVLVIAACAGIASFSALRLLSIYRKRGRSGLGSSARRPLQTGPYIVTRRKE